MIVARFSRAAYLTKLRFFIVLRALYKIRIRGKKF